MDGSSSHSDNTAHVVEIIIVPPPDAIIRFIPYGLKRVVKCLAFAVIDFALVVLRWRARVVSELVHLDVDGWISLNEGAGHGTGKGKRDSASGELHSGRCFLTALL